MLRSERKKTLDRPRKRSGKDKRRGGVKSSLRNKQLHHVLRRKDIDGRPLQKSRRATDRTGPARRSAQKNSGVQETRGARMATSHDANPVRGKSGGGKRGRT